MSVKGTNAPWILFPVACLALGILPGCERHGRSNNAEKPPSEAKPLFNPESASLAQQKMCDEQAAKRFHENSGGKETLSSYTSHYDPAVNVCYVRINSTSAEKFPVASDVVFDAFGGRTYASYMWINSQNKKYWEVSPSQCEIRIPGKPVEKCNSQEEFDEMTEKYFGVTP